MVEPPSFTMDDFYAGMAGLNGGLAYGNAMADYGQVLGIDLGIPLAAGAATASAFAAGAAIRGDYQERVRDAVQWARNTATDAAYDAVIEDRVLAAVDERDAAAVEALFSEQVPGVNVQLIKPNSGKLTDALDTVEDWYHENPVTVARDIDATVDRALLSAYLTADEPLDDIWGIGGIALDRDAIEEDRIRNTLEEEYDDMQAVEDYLDRRDIELVDTVRDGMKRIVLDGAQHVSLGMKEPVADTLYRDAVRHTIPPCVDNEDVTLRYTGGDLDPYGVLIDQMERFATFLDTYGSDVADDALDRLDDTLTPDELEALRDDLLHEADILPTRLEGEEREAFIRLRDETNRNALTRYRPGEALDALDMNWGTADLPYTVYEIDDQDTLATAAREIGTCRREETYQDYYEAVVEDPETVVLGLRRHDEDRWIGFSRNYLLDAPEADASVFGIDALEMVYKEGREGDQPQGACNFEEYGDVPIVLGLAGMRYALGEGLDYVVVGNREGRVGGGPAEYYEDRAFGPGDMYRGTSSTTIWLDKQDPIPTNAHLSSHPDKEPTHGFPCVRIGNDHYLPDRAVEHDFLMEPIRPGQG